MNQEQLTQALRLTIDELKTQLATEITTKNLFVVQLTEAQQQNAELQARVAELEALLDEQTQPEKGEL